MVRKKGTIWPMLFVLIIFLSRIVCSEERGNFKPKLRINIKWGPRYLNIGDINKHLETYDNYFSELTSYKGREIKKLNNYQLTFEGELRLDVSSKFAIGIGIESFSEKNDSYFEFTDSYPFYYYDTTENFHSISTKPEVSAVQLKFGTYYTIPLFRRINISLNGGIDYYFSKASLYKYHKILPGFIYIPEMQYKKEDKYDVSSNGFGFHGGIGFEYKITNSLAEEYFPSEVLVKFKNVMLDLYGIGNLIIWGSGL